jgi:tRNA G18 (ribose-2'-O)-methylase SpoU
LSIIAIDHPDDPRVAPYRDVRERDLVGREGLFIAEGDVVVRVLLGPRSRHRAVSLLVAEKRVEALAPLAEAADVPVYSAPQAVFDGIAGFHIHRGILALGRRAPAEAADGLLGSLGGRALVVVLSGIANHDNMGGICRNAAAFGADAVILDGECCDPFYRKAIRVSAGAVLTLRFARVATADDALAALAAHGFTTLALSPSGSETLARAVRPDRVAVMFGAEGPGLPSDVLKHTRTVRIPMAEGMDSLNVATTSGIVLHHLTR